MKKIFLFTLLIHLLSCNSKRADLANSKHQMKDDEMHKITRVDSIDDLYLIYAVKNEKYYKIVSKKKDSFNNSCSKIRINNSYKLKLESILYKEKNRFSHDLQGINYHGTVIEIEKDSITDIFSSININGLCYKDNDS